MSSSGAKLVRPVAVPTANLEVPQELAYLLDQQAGMQPLHNERNWVNAVGRVPEDNEKPKLHLPGDINSYSLPNFFLQHNIQFNLGARTTPLDEPIVPKPSREMTKKSLHLFQLILRFAYDDALSPMQDQLIGSYIVQLAMISLELREEAYLQLMNQCVNNEDEVALYRTWLLLANLLSACKPVDRLERYVIKFVSDHASKEVGTLLQHKCLSARPQCRLFPPASLEWKANQKNCLMALNLRFVDGHETTVDVESFSVGDELARHILILRSDSTLGARGWSLALQSEDETVEAGGHSFVLDPIACAELRPSWTKVGGSDGNQFFLKSRRRRREHNRSGDSDRLLRPGMHPTRVMALESPRGQRNSELDSWLEDVFDQALTSEASADPSKVQGWMNGLGDAPTGLAGVVPTIPAVSAFGSPIYGMPDPYMTAQTAQLQAAIQQAQLQNQLLQYNVQREVLSQQLSQLQAANPHLPTGAAVPLLMQQQPLQASFPVAPRQPTAAAARAPSTSADPSRRRSPEADSPRNHSESYQPDPEWRRGSSSALSDAASFDWDRRPNDPASPDAPGRARPVRIGGINWPPPKSEAVEEQKPTPKRLVPKHAPEAKGVPKYEPRSPQPVGKAPWTRPSESEAPETRSSESKAPWTKPSESKAPWTKPSEIKAPWTKPSESKAPWTRPSESEASETRSSESKAPWAKPSEIRSTEKTIKSTSVVIMKTGKAERSVTSTETEGAERKTSKIEDMPKVNVADRAQRLANVLLFPNSETLRTAEPSKPPEPQPQPSRQTTASFFKEHSTMRLEMAPEVRRYMYTLVPWHLVLRKELFSPVERADSPMLLDLIVAQIVFDVLKRPCIRLSPTEHQDLRKTIDQNGMTADIPALKKQPLNVKKALVEKAKATQFYFGRFHAAEWYNPSSNAGPLSWLILSHSGIHLAYQSDLDTIKLLKTLHFEDVYSIVKVDVRVVTISLRNNDRYDIICHMNATFTNLAQTYLREAEQIKRIGMEMNGGGAHVHRSASKVSSLRNEIAQDVSAGLIAMRTESHNGYDIRRHREVSRSMTEGDFFMMPYIKQNFRPELIEKRPQANLRWSKSPLRTSLHDIECPKLAVESSLAILTFTRNYPLEKNTEYVDCALILLEIPTRNRAMVDEIYCQLIKQTRPVDEDTPSKQSLLDAWRLFALFAMFNNASDALYPYLLRYLQEAEVRRQGEEKPIIGRVLRNLEQTRTYGGRRIFPMRRDMEMELNGSCFVALTLITPCERALFQVTQISVVKEVIDDFCQSIGVADEFEKSEFTLFSVVTKENISTPLNHNFYIFDLQLELNSNARPYYFYLCRTAWATELHLQLRSEAYVRLLHRQTMMDYLNGSWMLSATSEEAKLQQAKSIVHLAALQWRVTHPGVSHIPMEEMRNLLPADVNRFQPPRDWYGRIKPELKMLKKYKELECLREAIYILTEWYLFGATRYAVTMASHSIFPEQNVDLLIARHGMVILEAVSHKFLARIPFADMLGYEISVIAQGPSRIDLKLTEERLLSCFSNQANKMVHMLNQYKKLAAQMLTANSEE